MGKIPSVRDLPFQEGDLIEGEDGRRYRVSESYPQTITIVGTDSDYARTISEANFSSFKKVK